MKIIEKQIEKGEKFDENAYKQSWIEMIFNCPLFVFTLRFLQVDNYT